MTGMEWKNRLDMYPFAEALGITTDSVMSAVGGGDRPDMWVVLYTETPTSDPAEWVWVGILREWPDGILRVERRTKFKTIAEFNEGLAEHMEQAMKGIPRKGEE